jgi:LPPG:FO 2-phospho-L-lactate transferase
MAEKCLPAVGVEVSAAGVGEFYGSRSADGILDGWLVDSVDAGTQVKGVEVRAVPLYMTDVDATVAMVRAAVELGGVRRA